MQDSGNFMRMIYCVKRNDEWIWKDDVTLENNKSLNSELEDVIAEKNVQSN